MLGLSGVTGSQRLDTLVIAKPAQDYSCVTDATAVVISASSGTISVHDGGATALELTQAHLGV